MSFKSINVFLAAVLFMFSAVGHTQELPAQPAYQLLADKWASITYKAPQSHHKTLLKQLYLDAKEALNSDAAGPELLTWTGIITASYAGAKGGLGALKLAKEARGYLTEAMSHNADALDGGARTSLGALYYQVPPWPIGFGDLTKAGKLLLESYQKYPQNIDVVYFYADYLLKIKDIEQAHALFQEAAALPVRETRLVADTGRKQQIQQKLNSIKR